MTNQEAITEVHQRAMASAEDDIDYCCTAIRDLPRSKSWVDQAVWLEKQRALARAPLEMENARRKEAISSVLPLLDQLPEGGSGQRSAEILRAALEG